MRLNPWLQRRRDIDRMRARLEREHYPRTQMGSIVALTGLAGLAASFLMLHAGLRAMGLRYFLAMLVAYAAFFLMLWLWLRTRAWLADLPSVFGSGDGPAVPTMRGAGGAFDGGGASASYDVASGASDMGAADAAGGVGDVGDVAGVAGDAAGAAGDAAGPLLVLAVLALAAGIVFSSVFVIYSAPVLFAELLVDGALAAGLYRGLRSVDQRHWMASALRRTAVPFLFTTLFVTSAGWVMGHYAPEAHSIGEVLQHRLAPPGPH
jgi:hypothetical protein